MQQPGTMFPVTPTLPHTTSISITTDQIQKYLDENKQLILAILDNQNLGKLADCARYQAQLQKNLIYLAAIADAQPQSPTIPTQAVTMAPLSPGVPFTNPRPSQPPPMHLNQPHPLRPPHNNRNPGGKSSIPMPNSGQIDQPDGVLNANSDGHGGVVDVAEER